MRLTFTGTQDVAAPREYVWERLLDPEAIGAAGPGVENVEVVDDRHYRVVTAFGVGFLKLRFRVQVELVELDPPATLRLSARGHAPGSDFEARVRVGLSTSGPERTRLSWEAVPVFGGMVARVGARLLEGVARSLTEEFWRDFARDIERAHRSNGG